MKAFRKFLIAILLFAFFSDFVAVFTLYTFYASHLPKVQNQSTGQIYEINDNHGIIVYGTKQEFQRLNVLEKLIPLVAIGFLIAVILTYKYGDFPSLKLKLGKFNL